MIYNRARANLVIELVKLPVVDPSTKLEASSAALAVVVLFHESQSLHRPVRSDYLGNWPWR
jgi:hypothetical protein